MLNDAFNLIKSSENILLHLHVKPDPDSVGSALAMHHALKQLGKKSIIIKGDSKLSGDFSFLPGYSDVVEKNYFETDLSQFDLFIIQDSAKVLISREGEIVFPDTLKTLVIDHHKTNEGFGDVNIIDPAYSATAELLYDLFVSWNIEITKDIAACLYMGIYGDTGGFRYVSTTPNTMKVVAALCEIYPDFPKLIQELDYNRPKEKIYFDALALNAIETFFEGQVAISTISCEAMQQKGIRREDSDNNTIAGTLITVKEWVIGVTIIEKAPGEISVSFRSKDDHDVSKIAVALGGGGHKLAAATTIKCSLEVTKGRVLDAIASRYFSR